MAPRRGLGEVELPSLYARREGLTPAVLRQLPKRCVSGISFWWLRRREVPADVAPQVTGWRIASSDRRMRHRPMRALLSTKSSAVPGRPFMITSETEQLALRSRSQPPHCSVLDDMRGYLANYLYLPIGGSGRGEFTRPA